MKKTHNKKILLVSLSIFAFIFLFSIHISAFAQQQAYQPLAPITGYTDNVQSGDLGAYVNGMFKLGIAIAGVLAVLMIVIGGVEYVSTDAVSGKSDGKARIQGAVWGLVLALFSYILLNTINPDLLNIGSFQKNLADHNDNVTVANTLTPTTLTLGGPIDTSISGTPDTGGASSAFTQAAANYGSYDLTNGATYSANNLAIDTDGTGDPGFDDSPVLINGVWVPQHQAVTSYAGLNSLTDDYVAVPTDAHIAPGTPVLVTDTTTGKQVQAIAGDNGSPEWGEMSVKTATDLGIYNVSQKNNVTSTDKITYTVGTKK